jgi:heme/copper-type cytochrome/quinol oxidase subunit 3
MEIPYVVTPRKDTGLFNSKIAIWLFLASEVMLFGGFFSAYVFLRLGADYPWPERALPVLPGLINTFVLIFSSVTVVFAWASLKMRQWRKFQMFMGITVSCAVVFMILKGIEYNVKLHHQALRLKDYTVIEGHLGKEEENGKPLLNHRGSEIEENLIYVETSKLTFNTVSFHRPWVEELLAQAEHHHAKITLAADVKAKTKITKSAEAETQGEVIAKAGEILSVDLLEKIQKIHLEARKNNSGYRTEALRKEWIVKKAENPGKRGWQIASTVNINMVALQPMLLDEIPSVGFKVEPEVKFDFLPRDIQEADGKSTLRDETVVEGKLLESPMVFHAVDAIDFQHLAMKAVAKGIDPLIAIENSWLIKNSPGAKEAWDWNKKQISKMEKDLIAEYGVDKKTGKPNREPTLKERYRVGWKDFIAKADGVDRDTEKIQLKEEFFGPDYVGRESKETFMGLSVPREQVGFAAKFTPAWNTYYAIYFTMTGLHGLHVIGGALVLAYYLFFGRKMYLSNPEWLANRVEIGGLFWHFVDLVWIFVFPILYLM